MPATVQQIAGAIGVAVIGIIFFAVAGSNANRTVEISHGFQVSLLELSGAALGTLIGLRALQPHSSRYRQEPSTMENDPRA